MLCIIVIFVSDEMFTYKSHVSVQVRDGPSGQPRVGQYTGGECLRVDGSVSVLVQVGVPGLVNTRNTCSVNSVLQALASCSAPHSTAGWRTPWPGRSDMEDK